MTVAIGAPARTISDTETARCINALRTQLTVSDCDAEQVETQATHIIHVLLEPGSGRRSEISRNLLLPMARLALIRGVARSRQPSSNHLGAETDFAWARDINDWRPEGIGKQLGAATIAYAQGHLHGIGGFLRQAGNDFARASKLSAGAPESEPNYRMGQTDPIRSLRAVHTVSQMATALTILCYPDGTQTIEAGLSLLQESHAILSAQLEEDVGVSLSPPVVELQQARDIRAAVEGLTYPLSQDQYNSTLINFLPQAIVFDWAEES